MGWAASRCDAHLCWIRIHTSLLVLICRLPLPSPFLSSATMALDNLSAVLHKTGDLRLEDRPILEPKDDEVQVRMAAVAICGSDVHFWMRGRMGDFVVKAPMVLGHEGAGVVSKVGKNVTHLEVGDRVAIEAGIPCRHCSDCQAAKPNLCKNLLFCATPPVDGNLCRYYTHPANLCFKLPDHVSFEEGALLVPLSVGVHACRRAGVTLGSSVLICGAGPIGLICLLIAKAMGASKIVVTDLLEARLKVAKEFGAHAVVKVGREQIAEDTAKTVEAALGEMPEITMECSGAESSIKLAILGTKSGGCVVLVGLGQAEVKVPMVNAAVREVDIRGIFRYANCFPTALAVVSSGQVNVKGLISHRFKLEDTLEAFEMSRDGTDGAIIVMVHP